MSESQPSDDAMFLDEEDELYGYGILNVHKNTFVSLLGSGPAGTDSELFNDPEEAIEHLEELQADLGSINHLRIVRVHLDNEVDKQASDRIN